MPPAPDRTTENGHENIFTTIVTVLNVSGPSLTNEIKQYLPISETKMVNDPADCCCCRF